MLRRRFKPIPDFPGYRVGSDGSVWSCWKRKGLGIGADSTFVLSDTWKEMRTRPDKDGYRTVRLTRAGQKFFKRVSCLVLTAFVGPCPVGYECRHRDGNRTNDCRKNLRWGTSKANQADRRRHGTLPMGESHKSAKLSTASVLEVVSLTNHDVSHAELGRRFGVTKEAIIAVRTGKTWRHITAIKPRRKPRG